MPRPTTESHDTLGESLALQVRLHQAYVALRELDPDAARSLVARLSQSAVKTAENLENTQRSKRADRHKVYSTIAALFVENGNAALTKHEIAQATKLKDYQVHNQVYATATRFVAVEDQGSGKTRMKRWKLIPAAFEEAKKGL